MTGMTGLTGFPTLFSRGENSYISLGKWSKPVIPVIKNMTGVTAVTAVTGLPYSLTFPFESLYNWVHVSQLSHLSQ